MNTTVGILLGALLAAGIILTYRAFQPAPAGAPKRSATPITARLSQARLGLSRAEQFRAAVGAAAGLIAAILTGWIVLALTLPVAVVLLPRLLAPGATNKARIERLTALEEWTRTLHGMLGSTAGLTEALTATLRSCPEPIRPELERLVTRLQVGRRVDEALREFAEDLDDPVGDLIVGTLIMSATESGGGLRVILSSMAGEVAKEVSIRRTIEADRAGPAREVRIMTVLVTGGLTFFVGFTNFGNTYATPTGQVVLGALIAGFIGCLMWIKTLSVAAPEPRFLRSREKVTR